MSEFTKLRKMLWSAHGDLLDTTEQKGTAEYMGQYKSKEWISCDEKTFVGVLLPERFFYFFPTFSKNHAIVNTSPQYHTREITKLLPKNPCNANKE